MILSSLQFQLYSTILTVCPPWGERVWERDIVLISRFVFWLQGNFLCLLFFSLLFFFFSCAPKSLQNKILISADASISPYLYYLLPDPRRLPTFSRLPCSYLLLGECSGQWQVSRNDGTISRLVHRETSMCIPLLFPGWLERTLGDQKKIGSLMERVLVPNFWA